MIRFDTRDKKPKLYSIAALTVIAAAVIALSWKGNPGITGALFVLYFTLVLVLLVRAFFGQLRYNPYSYNTIYYIGFALFLLSVCITHLVIAVRVVHHSDLNEMREVIGVLLNSAKQYMLISLPLIVVFSVALCISNISLIRHEGKKTTNLLGIMLSVLLVAGEALLFCFDHASGVRDLSLPIELTVNLFAAIYLYFECMVIGALVADIVVARYEPDPDRDFMIILGCRPRKDGTPAPLLRGRIDRALAFDRRQQALTGKKLIFITSGGMGSDELISESACMKRYLLEQGVDAARIIEEDRSRNTFENMTFSKRIIESVDPHAKIAFSTTNYHVFRSGIYARRVKMRAVGVGAPTKWYFWPNAGVREFVGLLKYHRGKQAAILGGLIAIYTVLTLVAR